MISLHTHTHTQIDEIEQRKEAEMQKAMKKLEMAQQMQKQVSTTSN